jgi:DNA-binding response OmpR family regulator
MMASRTLLIVDDDDDFREALVEQFELYDEFDVLSAPDGRSAVRIARERMADMLVLDADLPDLEGFEVVRMLRAAQFAAPILILSGKDKDADIVRALDAGANDYVIKPLRFSVLLARIRAHLRQYEAHAHITFPIGPLIFRPHEKMLQNANGGRIRLTDKEVSILKCLRAAAPERMTREELARRVWGQLQPINVHTVESHIYRLRQKMEPSPSSPRLLLTEEGGYRLAGSADG